jgi:glycerol-1-phosphate dehydrogenase [NAD(P)+]
MDIDKIIKKYNIPIQEVVIEKELFCNAPELFRSIGCYTSEVLLVTDKSVLHIAQEIINRFSSTVLVLEDAQADWKTVKEIVKKGKDHEYIVAVGSGVINDLCKVASHKLKIPYIIFPTAPSMNGYASANASIKVKSHKTSIPAQLPIAIYCDTDVIRSAPLRLIRSGIGDSLCFSTCRFDWLLSYLILGTPYDPTPFEILKPYHKLLLSMAGGLMKKFDFNKKCSSSDIFSIEIIDTLMETLIVSGLGMYIAGNSNPASQAEHLIAHYIEIKYPKEAKLSYHGEQIAISTLEIIDIQKEILKQKTLKLRSKRYSIKSLSRIFKPKLAEHFLQEVSKKNISYYQVAKINANLEKFWPKYRAELEYVFIEKDYILDIFNIFGLTTQCKKIGIKKATLKESLNNAHLIRDRFTSLDLKRQLINDQ